jgi:phosphopantetheinyl transferase
MSASADDLGLVTLVLRLQLSHFSHIKSGQEYIDDAGLVKKCFALEEADYWHSLDKAEQGRAFYQFWVRKEAFVKADGKGITLGLNQCVINPVDLNGFLRVPESCGSADLWRIDAISLSEEVMAAVVCDQQDITLRFLDFNQVEQLSFIASKLAD